MILANPITRLALTMLTVLTISMFSGVPTARADKGKGINRLIQSTHIKGEKAAAKTAPRIQFKKQPNASPSSGGLGLPDDQSETSRKRRGAGPKLQDMSVRKKSDKASH